MADVNLLKEQTKEFLLDRYGIVGSTQSNIGSLDFYISDKTHDFISTVYEPSLCIILQGAKAIGFGDEMYGYDERTYALASTHVPLNVSLTDASKEKPYISLCIKFSLDEVYEVLKGVGVKEQSLQKSEKGIFFGELTDEILEPVLRFVWLLEKPKDKVKFLSDLAKKRYFTCSQQTTKAAIF